ncbi:MAG: type IX secretion system sortase PorU, partial [Bacteroidales bacterium]|nr:type IX secretion system sortase PorU [Bacteroidales bacterium]
ISNENWNLSSENSQMQIRYKKAGDRTLPVYLDYLKIYYQRKLNFINRQMIFSTLGHNNCKNIGFSISNANQNVRIWDIGNQLSPQSVNTVFAGNNLSFVSDSSFTEYIAFSEATTYQIARFLPVANQNLHQLEKIDYVIITYPDFHNEAEQLAEWHRDRGLSVVVAEPEKIYNEFSFGRQDPMGIRKFLRYLRNKAFAQNDMHHAPKYLCLFGGASYDYKNRTNVFKNFVPNYQFPTMLRDDYCLSTDDMYAFLDDGEDGWATFHTQDIAVGRLPVTNIEQAQNVLNKIFTYASPNRIKTTAGAYSNFGDWRNVVTNIADNGTGTDFVGVYEDNVNFESYFKTHYPHINLEKIYIDAFPLEITGSGARAPEAKKVLKQRVERGTLILNYEGHSGEVELGDEHILDISDINAFENYNNLTVLFSASCSFSHYDNPERVSGGEWSMLAPNGFAIASIATTRIAYVYPNYLFHGYWLHRMLDRTNGKAQTLGEAFRLGRNDSQNQYKLRPFVLLGDPALPVALPKYKINTLSINDIPIEEEIDTLKALSQVNIKGNITDFDSNLLDNFNGYITVTIFDKPSVTHTLGQPVSTTQGSAPIFEYYVQKNVIYKGKTKVENGFFSIDFTVPIDIKYNFGNGKISYYAYCDTADAVGVFTDVVIGGFGDSFELVAEAPVVKLFMNDSNFVSGNITNKNPMLLAVVEDKYGINFSGSGIGHDIVMIIDGNSKNPYILNDFFEYVDGYTVGNLTYLLQNLQPGHHKISLKIWNIFNISTLAEIDFVVVEENNLVVGTVYNYPNPVADGTYFYFTHNEPKKINSVEINIFDYIGRKMKTIRKEFTPINSFAIEPIYWDRETDGGQSFGNGLYPYNVIVRCEDGQSKTVSGKLLLK